VAVAAGRTGVGSTQHVSRCGIGVRGHGEEEPFSLWFCPVRKLMLSAGPLFTPRFSWSASLVKLGFFVFVRRASGGLACSLPESWPLRSAPPSARAHAAQFRANRHPASADATGLRVDLIEDEVKPGEEENNKVRRRELLSFFTG
jgi:hypothetical protein